MIANNQHQGKNRTKALKTNKTLVSNTGLKMQGLLKESLSTFLKYGQTAIEEFWHYENKQPETFCDWLTFCSNKSGITEASLSEILNQVLIGSYWGKTFEVAQYDSTFSLFRGGSKFNYQYKNQIGISLSTGSLDNGNQKAILKLSGSILSQLFKRNDLLSVAQFIAFLSSNGFHLSRIDLSIDDYQKKLDCFQVSDWVNSGNYQFFKEKKIHLSGTAIKGKNLTNGLTIDCGSRQSHKMIRIYDTFYKHGKKATRIELELKDKKAKFIENFFIRMAKFYEDELNNKLHGCNKKDKTLLHGCNEKLLREVQNIILSCVSFCDKSKGKRVGTKIEYPEFIEWIDFKKYINKNLKKRKLVVCSKKPSIKGSWDFLNKQVKGTIALLVNGLGREKFDKLIDLLLLKDKEKIRPLIIDKDKSLMVAELKSHGINAILSESETQQIFNEYGIDFGTNTSYYEPKIKEDSITANKQLLRSLLKKNQVSGTNQERLKDELNNPLFPNNYFNQDKTLYNDLLDNYQIIEFLFKKVPSLFSQLINKLNIQERETVLEYCEQLA